MTDPALSMCMPATRGIWMDLLCAIHNLACNGQLRGTAEQLARLARCRSEEMVDALTELQITGTAGITERNGTFTVLSRRIQRDSAQRELWKTQKQKQRTGGHVRECPPVSEKCPPNIIRDKHSETKEILKCPEDVHPMSVRSSSSSSSSSSFSKKKTSPPPTSSSGLAPEIVVIADRIFLSDKTRFQKLVVWIREKTSEKCTTEMIVRALSDFEQSHVMRGEDSQGWWKYLNGIMDRVWIEVNQGESAKHKSSDPRLVGNILKGFGERS